MREPPAIAVLRQRRFLGGHAGYVGRASSPAKLGLQTYTLLGVMSVTNEHAPRICFQNGTRGQGGSFAGEGARATQVGESRSSPAENQRPRSESKATFRNERGLFGLVSKFRLLPRIP
jgi:hypothetical protein